MKLFQTLKILNRYQFMIKQCKNKYYLPKETILCIFGKHFFKINLKTLSFFINLKILTSNNINMLYYITSAASLCNLYT